jgi:5-methylcytosine-specific restriction endonuclease McrA
MDAATRSMVRQRSGNRCEYCGILQEQMSAAAFHVDHIIPKQHGGSDDPSNLALACYHCNLRKGPNLTGIDPDTGALVSLFHPRQERWDAHFAFRETLIVGLTPYGPRHSACAADERC